MRSSQEAVGVSDTVRGTATGRGYRLFYYYYRLKAFRVDGIQRVHCADELMMGSTRSKS